MFPLKLLILEVANSNWTIFSLQHFEFKHQFKSQFLKLMTLQGQFHILNLKKS